MSATHVEHISGVDVVVQRPVNQLLRFIASQLRYSTQHAQNNTIAQVILTQNGNHRSEIVLLLAILS